MKKILLTIFILIAISVNAFAIPPFPPSPPGQPANAYLTQIGNIAGARGDMIYYGALGWIAITAGTAGDVLTQGANDPEWVAPTVYQASDADLSTLAAPTAWRVFYSDGSSVVTELALGADGTYLKSGGAAAAPAFEAFTTGTIAAAGDATDFPAATAGDWYQVSSAGWLGGAAGVGEYSNVGDLWFCNTTSAAGTLAEVGGKWNHYRHVISQPDGYSKILLGNNTAASPTAATDELYFEANIFKINQNGTESSVPIGPTAGQITFSRPMQARTVNLPDADVTFPANPIGGTLGATANVIPKANGTGTATLQASGITEDGTNVSIGALNLVATGQVTGRIVVITDADGKTLSGTDLYGSMQLATGSGTWTIPDVDSAAGTGQSFCVYTTTAAEIVIAGDAEDKIRLDGTLGAAGGDITNNTAEAAGDYICLVLTDFATDVAHWTVLGKIGTWTVVP